MQYAAKQIIQTAAEQIFYTEFGYNVLTKVVLIMLTCISLVVLLLQTMLHVYKAHAKCASTPQI